MHSSILCRAEIHFGLPNELGLSSLILLACLWIVVTASDTQSCYGQTFICLVLAVMQSRCEELQAISCGQQGAPQTAWPRMNEASVLWDSQTCVYLVQALRQALLYELPAVSCGLQGRSQTDGQQ